MQEVMLFEAKFTFAGQTDIIFAFFVFFICFSSSKYIVTTFTFVPDISMHTVKSVAHPADRVHLSMF